LRSVTIGDSVKSIGEGAFWNCIGLESVTIGDSVESIGDHAFNGCISLTSVTIPDSVKNIGNSAFSGCTSLESATIGSENIGNYAFYGCTGLESVIIGDSVESIGDHAFNDCTSLGSVTIGSSVEIIGDYAFRDCISLTSIVIPDSVKIIGNYAFQNCTSLGSVTIGDSVESIGEYAFWDCLNLVQLVTGSSLKTSGFWWFTSLTSVTIGGSAESIGDYAFRNCTSLESVTIGDSVKSIGDYAFSSCISLTSIIIPDSVENVGDWAFSGCISLTSIIIPDSVENVGDWAFSGCINLTSVIMPNSVKSIGDWVFYSCTGLTSVIIPDSVKSIGYGAFQHCTSLTSVIIPGSVESIGDYAFHYCPSLISIIIPDSVKSIGGGAFSSCTSLGSVTLSSSVESIGDGVFSGCTSLESVTLSSSVESIGDYAFSGCTGLISIIIPNSVKSIGYGAFQYCTGLISIIIPDSVKSIGDYAFWNCTSLGSVTIGGSVESIGNYAFQHCTSLTSVIIPVSVESIGDYAFWYGNLIVMSTTIPEETLRANNAVPVSTVITDGYFICLVPNGGDHHIAPITKHTVMPIPEPVTTRYGHTFSGWYSDKELTIPYEFPDTLPEAYVTVYAKWAVITHSVTLTPGTGYTITAGGSTDIEYGRLFEFTVDVDPEYDASTLVVRVNGTVIYATEGVYSIYALVDDTTVNVEVSIQMYAVTVSGNAGGSFEYRINGIGDFTPLIGGSVDVPHGSAVELRGVPGIGYQFAWDDQAGVAGGVKTLTNVTSSQSVSGTFSLKTYNVTLTQGTGYTLIPETGSSTTTDHGGTFTFVFSLLTGYTQSNYSILVNGNLVPLTDGKYTIPSITEAQTVTVTGVTQNAYTVSLPTGIGYSVTPYGGSSSPVTYGGSYTFGFTLNGNYSASLFTVYINGIVIEIANGGHHTIMNIASDQTVTVTGVTQNTYGVTYNLNGGTGTAPTETSKISGAVFPAKSPTGMTAPTEHMRFKEWNLSADGTGTSYVSGATITMPSNAITLYAIWEYIHTTSTGNWVKGTSDDLTITIQGVSPGDLDKVWLGGKELTRNVHYDVIYGSVILRIFSEHLETLSPGTHSVVVSFLDGKSVSTSLTVSHDDDGQGMDMMIIMIVIAVIAIVGIGAAVAIKRKR
jgi:uncharacterized repeat protein (TIGR02543 family)